MRLTSPVYSVLVVADADNFKSNIREFLPESTFSPVVFADTVDEAKRLSTERFFDLVIVNGPLKEDNAIDFSKTVVYGESTALMYIISHSLYDQARDFLSSHGIILLPRPAGPKTLTQAINDLCAMRERLRRLEKKNISLESRMKEIRLENRAKLLLIEKKGMSENEAHKYLEKQAMDNSISKSKFAELLIGELS